MYHKQKTVYTILAVLTAFLIVLGSGTVLSNAAANSYIRGDADGDGTVTIIDATVIQRRLCDIEVKSFNESAADVDGNGLDITDVTRIQRWLADIPDAFGIGELVSINPSPTQDEYELPFVSL